MERLFDDSAALQFLAFRVSEECFAIDLEDVKEIVRFRELIPIPEGPHFIEGLITLRGMVVPAIDLGKRLVKKAVNTKPGKAVIVDIDSHVVALMVDEIEDIIAIRREEIIRPRKKRSGKTGFIKGLVKLPRGTVELVDPDRLLTAEEKVFFETPITRSGLEVEEDGD